MPAAFSHPCQSYACCHRAPPFVVTWTKPKSEITARFGSVAQTVKPIAHSPHDHFFQLHPPLSSPVHPVAMFAFPVHCITCDHDPPR